jgi:SAM-dependent methyltransferase
MPMMKSNKMNYEELIQDALSLPFKGWDFSFLSDRWKTNPPSWDYPSIARSRMQGISSMLDQDTGGGEMLACLAPFPPSTWASENYPPNIPVAKNLLEPLGIQIITDYTISSIPLADSSLDLVLNRHGGYSERELFRLLKPGGIFLTQQVGGQNCFRLNELFQSKPEFMYSYWTKDYITSRLEEAGFELLDVREEFPIAEFADIGVVVFCLRIVSWQISDFSVEKYHDKLYAIHQQILTQGPLQVREHRILVETRKLLR